MLRRRYINGDACARTQARAPALRDVRVCQGHVRVHPSDPRETALGLAHVQLGGADRLLMVVVVQYPLALTYPVPLKSVPVLVMLVLCTS